MTAEFLVNLNDEKSLSDVASILRNSQILGVFSDFILSNEAGEKLWRKS